MSFGGFGRADFREPGPLAFPDTITSLGYSERADAMLLATCWSGEVRVVKPAFGGQSAQIQGDKCTTVASITDRSPVLCSTWTSAVTNSVAYGGCDNTVKLWDMQRADPTHLGTHDAPVRKVVRCSETSVITGGWDSKVKLWDTSCKPDTAVQTRDVGGRVFAMDFVSPILVVATHLNQIKVMDVRAGLEAFVQDIASPLKMQCRDVAVFPEGDQQGYLIAGVEGRCAVHHVRNKKSDFTFKCHRQGKEVYSVNSVCFNTRHTSFLTTGADGGLSLWDKQGKRRLKQFLLEPQPLGASAWCTAQEQVAVAVGYELSKGPKHAGAAASPGTGHKIVLHEIEESWARPKPN